MDRQKWGKEGEGVKNDKKEETKRRERERERAPEISVMLGKLRQIRATTILLIIHYLQYSLYSCSQFSTAETSGFG